MRFGAPSPVEVDLPGSVGGGFADGAAFSDATGNVVAFIPVAGATRIRVRIKTAGIGGTLASRFCRPNATRDEYTANNPADVTVAVDVENKLDVDPHFGEAWLKLIFTPAAGSGTFDYVDASRSYG